MANRASGGPHRCYNTPPCSHHHPRRPRALSATMSSSLGPTSMPIARSAPMSMGSLLHPPEATAQPQYAPYTSAHPYAGYSHDQYAYHPYQTYGAMQSPASAPSQVPSASEYEYSEAISYDAPRRRGPSMMNNAPHQYRRQQGDYAPAPPARYAQESAPSYSDGSYYGGHAGEQSRPLACGSFI